MPINAQPFNPTFKLVGTLQQDQVLVYDVSENAFVNNTSTGTGAGGGGTISGANNSGPGAGIFSGVVGSELQFKSLIAGADINITDNGDALIISANFTASSQIQDATNLGAGLGIFSQKNINDDLEFKSITVGPGLLISDNGTTITIDVDNWGNLLNAQNNLADLADFAQARANLGVLTETELDGMYVRRDNHSVPTYDSMWDLGSPTRRWQDIYADTFQGTATAAMDLTIPGSVGEVLTYNGSSWVSAPPTIGGGGGGPTPNQTLSVAGNLLTISGGNTVTIPTITPGTLVDVMMLDRSNVPTLDLAFDIGSPVSRYQDIYADTFQGTAVASDSLTITGNIGDFLVYNGSAWVASDVFSGSAGTADNLTITGAIGDILVFDGNEWVATAAAGISPQTLGLGGTILSISGGNSIDIAQTIDDLLDVEIATVMDDQVLKYNNLSGNWENKTLIIDYNDLNNKPVIPSDIGDLVDVFVNAPADGQILRYNNLASEWVNVNLSLLDLAGISDGPAGAHLTTDGVGNFTWTLDAGTVGFNNLTDATITAATDGDFVRYNNVSSQWENTQVTLLDLGITDGPAGSQLSTDGAGNFVFTTSTTGSIDDLADVDTTTVVPTVGDTLEWDGANWVPTENAEQRQYFKVNYDPSGTLISITDMTAGVSANIISPTGGTTEVVFNGYDYPPLSVMIYGYSHSTNEYNMMPLNKDITIRKIDAGGTPGNPVAFGNLGSLPTTINLREADTGASRSFGSETHAWIVFHMHK